MDQTIFDSVTYVERITKELENCVISKSWFGYRPGSKSVDNTVLLNFRDFEPPPSFKKLFYTFINESNFDRIWSNRKNLATRELGLKTPNIPIHKKIAIFSFDIMSTLTTKGNYTALINHLEHDIDHLKQTINKPDSVYCYTDTNYLLLLLRHISYECEILTAIFKIPPNLVSLNRQFYCPKQNGLLYNMFKNRWKWKSWRYELKAITSSTLYIDSEHYVYIGEVNCTMTPNCLNISEGFLI